MPRLPRRAMLLGAASLLVSVGEAAARSGVIADVAHDPSVASAPNPALRTGAEIEIGQTIATGSGELVNLLFIDGTSLTLGQESTVRVDSCLFDTTSGKGVLALTLKSGVCRLICGAIGRTGEITLATPAGSIAARDAIARFVATPSVTIGLVEQGELREVPATSTMSPGNLRQAIVSDKTKFSSIIINRFAKWQGSKEEPAAQTITSAQADFLDHDHGFPAVFSYEKIEIKDFKVKAEDGTLDGSPIVTSYNRLTGEVNAATAPQTMGSIAARRPSVVQRISAVLTNRPYQATIPSRR